MYLYALYREKSTMAGRCMRRELLRLFEQEGLTAMRNRSTLLRAEENRVWVNCALFASYRTPKIEYNIRDG
jgi:hypothetical protein